MDPCASLMDLSNKLRQMNASDEHDRHLQDEIFRLMCSLSFHGYAHNVAHVLHQDIQGAPATHGIELLRCVVRMVNRVQQGVWSCFELWLSGTVEGIYETICEKKDTENKSRLELLRNEWRDLLSYQTLKDIDERLRQLDGDWPLFEYANQRQGPLVRFEVACMRPPVLRKPSTSAHKHAKLPKFSCKKPSSPKVIATKGITKQKTKRPPLVECVEWKLTPLQLVKKPSIWRSITDSRFRPSCNSSNKENDEK